jgi:hypothetical protein
VSWHGCQARGRGTVQVGPGVRGRSPCFKQIRAAGAPFQERSAGRPEGGAFTARRAQPKRRVGELAASPKPRAAGAAKRRLADKEETRQAAQSLLAAVNAPGTRGAAGRRRPL